MKFSLIDKHQSLTSCRLIPLTSYSVIRKATLLLALFMATFFTRAQSVFPCTINISGQSFNSGNYQFEWSVGESASIITLTSSNLVVTSGILQSFVAYQPEHNTATNFLPGEVKIYPNPTKDIIEINMLLALAGKSNLQLYDLQGRKLMERQFDYLGLGSIEKWDLRHLAAGQYLLNLQLVNPVTGKTIKKGAFKIIKIQ